MTNRKIPLRKCIGCNQMKDKRELVRIVKNKDGDISVDLTGKANGRGAYICKSEECLKKARKASRLERAFSSQISTDVYDKLQKEIKDE